jgi:hypothetical protein
MELDPVAAYIVLEKVRVAEDVVGAGLPTPEAIA